jgi:inhibitor of cysteine peptidase
MLGAMAELLFSSTDNGASRDARVGDTVSIALPENPMSGYRWAVELASPELSPTADAYRPDAESETGGGGIRTFSFAATAAGSARIVLRSARSWEADPASERFEIALEISS